MQKNLNNSFFLNTKRELDGMPGATVSYTNEAPEHNYRIGFPLGFKKVSFYLCQELNQLLTFFIFLGRSNIY
jgi:hypothetical protein